MEVTLEDIKHVINTYMVKFFDPNQSCCALMGTEGEEKARLIKRLTEMGYKIESMELTELCTNL